ncbi:MAG: serine hydrolase [Nesterenkonia sp.]|uniref:serine hydrolase n=1 Tax=Garicola koreensis TaxID=1262554 RepID=UPI0031E6E4AE
MNGALISAVIPAAKLTAAGVLAAVLLSACGDADEPQELDQSAAAEAPTPLSGAETEEPEEQTADPDPSQDAGAAADHGVELPQTPAGTTARYVLSVLNAESDSTAEDWEDRLHQDALAELSPTDLATVINTTIRPQGPWSAAAYDGDDTQSLTRLEADSGELDLHIAVDETDQLITTLYFGEVSEPVETAESFQDVEERLIEFPGDVRALILQDGEPLLDLRAEEPAPLASVAKLYVLLATVEAIDEGETSWDESLEVTEELRSLPSGTLQDQPEGYTTTVYDVAHRMIELSDNTGTDMLIDHLGRDAVEEAVVAADHHRPELLRPFLTTRELFQLRWDQPQIGDQWADAGEDQRRELLEELNQMPLEIAYEDIDAEDTNAEIGWRANAYDIAAVHQELAQRTEEHSELISILGSNPGLPTGIEDPWWQRVAFKGGSLPGVLTGSWHAVGEDGEQRTVVLLAEHDDAAELRSEADEQFGLAADALTIRD